MPPPTQTQPTLRDIADRLSLSTWTVCKALNGQSGVSEVNRRRIAEVAEDLGYVPNRQARSLRRGRTGRIVILLPTLFNPVFSERMNDIYEAAEENGLDVQVTSFEWDRARYERLCEQLIGERVEAVVMHGRWKPFVKQFIKAGILPILISGGAELEGAAILNVDRAESTRLALEHLLTLGHRQPLLVGNWITDNERMEGIRNGLREAGLAENDYRVIDLPTHDPVQPAYDCVRETFAHHAHLPTAIIADNDMVAMSIIAALHSLGVSVPGQISVVGRDNIAMSRFCIPPLTTVSQTHLRLGRRAVEMAVAILGGKMPPTQCQWFTPELIVRESTGPAPVNRSQLNGRSFERSLS